MLNEASILSWAVFLRIVTTLVIARSTNCSGLCGGALAPYSSEPCNDPLSQSSGLWRTNALEFMKFIGLNGSNSACVRERVKVSSWKGTNLKDYLTKSRALGNISEELRGDNPGIAMGVENEVQRFPRSEVPGMCEFHVDRRLVVRNASGTITYRILYISASSGSKRKGEASLIGIQNIRTNSLLSQISLPSSLFRANHTNGDSTGHYSMFTNWTVDDIPGMKEMRTKLRSRKSPLDDIDGDYSSSNLAILVLPLLMAIPPVSVLEPVSTATTVWYVIATDILAALPLLIKGIELVIVHAQRPKRLVSTLSLGHKYEISETWTVICRGMNYRTGSFGIGLIFVALWFMVASTYTEYIFWRALPKNRKDQTEDNQIHARKIEEYDDVPVDFAIEVKPTRTTHIARYRFFLLLATALLLCVGFSLAIYDCTKVSGHLSKNGSEGKFPALLHITTALLLTVLRAIWLNQLSQFLRWRFIVGIGVGLFAGPLHLFLLCSRKFRHSELWNEVASGANIGFGVLAMMLAAACHLEGLAHMVFVSTFGICTGILHAIRSSERDRTLWRYGLHALVLGLLFGPFGFLFIRKFPETQKKKQARLNFIGGFGYGLVLLCTLAISVQEFLVDWRVSCSASYKLRPFLGSSSYMTLIFSGIILSSFLLIFILSVILRLINSMKQKMGQAINTIWHESEQLDMAL